MNTFDGHAPLLSVHFSGFDMLTPICYSDFLFLPAANPYFDDWDRQAVQKRLVRRLEKLGYEVTLTPTEPPA